MTEWPAMWRIVKRTILGLVILILAVVGGGLVYRVYQHHEIARATAIDPARGIDEAFFAKIGGIDQWIGVRGQDRANPIVLVLHPGFGTAHSAFPRNFLFNWTRDFTVVLWDQRGAGKTFTRSGPVGSSITIDRMALDGIEVAEFVRTRLHQPRDVLLGHSWGSMLGVRMIKARPDLFAAYVGTGQVVNQGKAQAVVYSQLLQEAQAKRDEQAIAELSALGRLPYDSPSKSDVLAKWAAAYEPGELSQWDLISLALFDTEAGPFELRDYFRGIVSSAEHFSDAVDKDDLPSLGTDFSVPFFVFQGAVDHVTPVALVKAATTSCPSGAMNSSNSLWTGSGRWRFGRTDAAATPFTGAGFPSRRTETPVVSCTPRLE
jgi:pimeloyl-ACP methyl ester carboxylesterase